MTFLPKPKLALALAAATLIFPATATFGQDAAQDDEEALASIVVTGAKIRQGGIQDIRQFRSLTLDGDFLPRADSLTIEGLLGEHDLSLPARESCRKLFCIDGIATAAGVPSRPQDVYFVGLGFESNTNVAERHAEPLSLIAVIDRSGSMQGDKIARAKEALLQAVSMMRDGDRLGIVEFGSETSLLLPVSDIGENRDRITKLVNAIEADGSTFMEAGLAQGFDVAFAEQTTSKRKTRIMLLTDEQPNVGNVEPEGFMGQAIAGSKRGVGLTTIGVGRDFDNALAMQISSVRGGNLFYLARDADAPALMQREFFNMVTEVAHDVEITLTPAYGHRITGLYGVPNEIVRQAPDGALTVQIGSAFLSSNGGGIFASLGYVEGPRTKTDGSLLTATVRYIDARTDVAGSDVSVVMQPQGAAPANLAKAQSLVDQYLTLTSGLKSYHKDGDRKAAYAQFDGLLQRMEQSQIDGLDKEVELVRTLRNRAAALAGMGKVPDALKPNAVVGKWEVTAERGLRGVARGDIIEITADGDMITYRKSGQDAGTTVVQTFQINENQLYIDYTDLVFQYRLKADRLRMRTLDREKLDLKRIDA